MTHFEYGPVELHLIAFDGERPDASMVEAMVELIDQGVIRLLDFTIVSKSDEGEITVTEIADQTDEYGFGGVELAEIGITGDDDIVELAELIPPGDSAAIVAFELVWMRRLAEKFDASGSVVLRTERIPAPVVNEVLALAEQSERESS